MRKKVLYILIGVGCLASGLHFYTSKSSTELSSNGYCAFCDPAILSRQTFYEDDLVLALYTHKPILPGHCLIIPKRHVERFEGLTDAEVVEVGHVIKKVNLAVMEVFKTTSYLLLQKNGREVGQTVPHVHFHYIPRKAGDDSTLTFLARMYIANIEQPIPAAEMQKIVEELKQAIH